MIKIFPSTVLRSLLVRTSLRLSLRGLAVRLCMGRKGSAQKPRTTAKQSVLRYYLGEFLAAQRVHLRGRVLEAGGDSHLRRFGRDAYSLHILAHPGAPGANATLTADLTALHDLPEDRFDCFVGASLFERFVDPRAALRGAYRMLRPGGVLLAAFPACVSGAADEPGLDDDAPTYWRFTRVGVERCLDEVFGAEHYEVVSFGNPIAAAAIATGLSVLEIGPAHLATPARGFEVLICAVATKPMTTKPVAASPSTEFRPAEIRPEHSEHSEHLGPQPEPTPSAPQPTRRMKTKRRPEAN